jgi:hypothetical protein
MYYPNGNLTDTVFSGNGSSTWHAIEYGLELLKKGDNIASGQWHQHSSMERSIDTQGSAP